MSGIPEGGCYNALSNSEVMGLSFVTLAGSISALAVVFVLGLFARNIIRNYRDPPPGQWKIFRTHVDAYMLCLLIFDLLQGLGYIMNILWLHERASYCGHYCTAQGAIQQIGEVGVAFATLAIALHTFSVIFWSWVPPRSAWLPLTMISLMWIFLLLWVGIGYGLNNDYPSEKGGSDFDLFYTPTPYWCWIGGNFNSERVAGEYAWLWVTAFTSMFLYIVLFFRIRGNIRVGDNWWRIRIRRRYSDSDDKSILPETTKFATREAIKMLWYPATYIILVLPLSIARWSTFRPPGGKAPTTPFAATATVVTIFCLSGLVNVLLLTITRPNLLLFGSTGSSVIGPTRPAVITSRQRSGTISARSHPNMEAWAMAERGKADDLELDSKHDHSFDGRPVSRDGSTTDAGRRSDGSTAPPFKTVDLTSSPPQRSISIQVPLPSPPRSPASPGPTPSANNHSEEQDLGDTTRQRMLFFERGLGDRNWIAR